MNGSIDSPADIEINEGFQKVIESLKGLHNVLLTGKAGTGKSTLLNLLIQNEIVQAVAVVAPTGVAAINVGGMTVHRFFSFPGNVTVEMVSSKDYFPGKYIKEIRNLKTLIIDEISMLRADLLDCIEVSLRRFGPKTNQPFGGVQMVFVGDLLQLPPLPKERRRCFCDTVMEHPTFFQAMPSIRFGLNCTNLLRSTDRRIKNS